MSLFLGIRCSIKEKQSDKTKQVINETLEKLKHKAKNNNTSPLPIVNLKDDFNLYLEYK